MNKQKQFTKYEYFMEMSKIARKLAKIVHDPYITPVYKNAEKQFKEKAEKLTVEQACMMATPENMRIYNHYADVLNLRRKLEGVDDDADK